MLQLPSLSLFLLTSIPWRALCSECGEGDCQASPSFLQTGLRQHEISNDEIPHRSVNDHYWPHAKGTIGHLSQSSFGLSASEAGNLSASLAWKWVHPSNLSAIVQGTLIDRDKNVIIVSRQGIYKHTAAGTLVWRREDVLSSQMPVIMGDVLYGMEATSAVMYALDLATGNTLWQKKVALTTGQAGDVVEGHNGVLVVAVDLDLSWDTPQVGMPAKRAIGVNASDGQVLWTYTPECGFWNIMALFPDESSTVFMDYCGGLYRVGLFDGSQIWRVHGSSGSVTEGGSTLGPDHNVYTCSNGQDTKLTMNVKDAFEGRLRKYNISDGSLMWETSLPNPCMNFPAVSPDGETVVLADGAKVLDPPEKWLAGRGNTSQEIDEFYALQQELLTNKSQLQYYGRDNLDASISGYDAITGKMKWTHDVKPWYGMSFALDEERAYLWLKGKKPLGYCGPPHWSGPTIDQEGIIYVSRSDGEFHIYDPRHNSDMTFHTGDGALLSGAAFADGLLVVPTCSWVYVFRF
eukprot:TRINITY_DN6496_c0_g2_i1.p1 TRINITY_DN6496_c0_g2~~TRINITY_DN6496_c0_g2_i1.p1  ORF type:complete len:518 (-),score=58.10 TRINITY_DN6496_c0_g2_i1:540-2093(-)